MMYILLVLLLIWNIALTILLRDQIKTSDTNGKWLAFIERSIKEAGILVHNPQEDKFEVNRKLKNYLSSSNSINHSSIFNDELGDDELYEKAKEVVNKAQKASTSFLQRKLRIGYARSAHLMDMLEENGVVGPTDGSKPREVLRN